jgi:hypothetical protein
VRSIVLVARMSYCVLRIAYCVTHDAIRHSLRDACRRTHDESGGEGVDGSLVFEVFALEIYDGRQMLVPVVFLRRL